MAIYKIIVMSDYSYVERTDDDGKVWAIPEDLDNADYQEYLASLNEPA